MDGLGFRQLIHKHFHIPGMMRHIGSRTGITRIQNIAHNVRFVSACHKENHSEIAKTGKGGSENEKHKKSSFDRISLYS